MSSIAAFLAPVFTDAGAVLGYLINPHFACAFFGSAAKIRDVAVPVVLQDAASRQAQAGSEKQARVIPGWAEAAIARKSVEAAAIYAGHPRALQLRVTNIIYEITKERGYAVTA